MKLSMCLAGIRPKFWKNVYDSALLSCSKYSFEIIFIGPYDLPEELQGINNIKYVKEFGNPVRASQRGVTYCSGELLCFPCDDGVFIEDGLNQAIELWDKVAKREDGMVHRYREGAGMTAPSFPMEYWNANHHLRGIGFEDHWKIAPQPMMNLEYYKELGGVDCLNFECMAFATWRLCYVIQKLGGIFHISPTEIMNADNYGTTNVDHAPIYYGQTQHDHPRFIEMQNNTNLPLKVDFNAWEKLPEKWSRRWNT